MSRHKPTTKRVLDILNEIAPAPDIPKNLPPHEAAMFAGEDHDDDDHRSLDRCHTSGKVCFPSQRFANRVMRQIQKKTDVDPIPKSWKRPQGRRITRSHRRYSAFTFQKIRKETQPIKME